MGNTHSTQISEAEKDKEEEEYWKLVEAVEQTQPKPEVESLGPTSHGLPNDVQGSIGVGAFNPFTGIYTPTTQGYGTPFSQNMSNLPNAPPRPQHSPNLPAYQSSAPHENEVNYAANVDTPSFPVPEGLWTSMQNSPSQIPLPMSPPEASGMAYTPLAAPEDIPPTPASPYVRLPSAGDPLLPRTLFSDQPLHDPAFSGNASSRIGPAEYLRHPIPSPPPHSYDMPPDDWIPLVDRDRMIYLPPPHELSISVNPPSSDSFVSEAIQPAQGATYYPPDPLDSQIEPLTVESPAQILLPSLSPNSASQIPLPPSPLIDSDVSTLFLNIPPPDLPSDLSFDLLQPPVSRTSTSLSVPQPKHVLVEHFANAPARRVRRVGSDSSASTTSSYFIPPAGSSSGPPPPIWGIPSRQAPFIPPPVPSTPGWAMPPGFIPQALTPSPVIPPMPSPLPSSSAVARRLGPPAVNNYSPAQYSVAQTPSQPPQSWSSPYWGNNRGSGPAPYPNHPVAAGVYVGTPWRNHGANSMSTDWKPAWTVFPLKVFRGVDHDVLKIQPEWDDEDLLRELKKKYDKLRTFWRKWFSLKSVGSLTMVLADHSFIYPQRIGPARVSAHRNLRVRHFLNKPETLKGRREFMQVLTERPDFGLEFVERWQAFRLAVAILLPIFLSLVTGVVYSGLTQDVSSAFTIAGYLTSAYSVCLVLVGVLNLVEF
ncbi:hypothetical protein A0H81_07390 [Grifola frondosa]|uniref:Uncharacterized protein n=1 Tax=Grifola frondosa TaxID=5627 RepID=A0A1C7M599_GRIFR|nr:hypothetical protein A0H81_07390 [Grifola frondosa]